LSEKIFPGLKAMKNKYNEIQNDCLSQKSAALNFCVLIPAFNAAKTIEPLIEQIKLFSSNIIVVNDGSSDDTALIIKNLNVVLISHAKNKGKGESLKSGFDYILKNTCFEYIMIMDSDAQHDPRFIPDFLKMACKHEPDIIIGNRMTSTRNMPLVRKLTNKTMSFIVSSIAKQNIPDSQCGYRFLKRRVLEQIKIETSKYDMESEILFKAAKKHFKISSVKISTVYKDQKSSINPFIDTFRFVRLLINLAFKNEL